jgi:hypothetical protein
MEAYHPWPPTRCFEARHDRRVAAGESRRPTPPTPLHITQREVRIDQVTGLESKLQRRSCSVYLKSYLEVIGSWCRLAAGSGVTPGARSTFNLRSPGPSGTLEQYAVTTNGGRRYDVFPDGTFLMIRGADVSANREIVLVQHWFEELERLVSR